MLTLTTEGKEESKTKMNVGDEFVRVCENY
jgi:hypothetical protein